MRCRCRCLQCRGSVDRPGDAHVPNLAAIHHRHTTTFRYSGTPTDNTRTPPTAQPTTPSDTTPVCMCPAAGCRWQSAGHSSLSLNVHFGVCGHGGQEALVVQQSVWGDVQRSGETFILAYPVLQGHQHTPVATHFAYTRQPTHTFHSSSSGMFCTTFGNRTAWYKTASENTPRDASKTDSPFET